MDCVIPFSFPTMGKIQRIESQRKVFQAPCTDFSSFFFLFLSMLSFRFYPNAAQPRFLGIVTINSNNNNAVIHMELEMCTLYINKIGFF